MGERERGGGGGSDRQAERNGVRETQSVREREGGGGQIHKQTEGEGARETTNRTVKTNKKRETSIKTMIQTGRQRVG